MNHLVKGTLCLAAALGMNAALAQQTTPVAYVYVSTNSSGGNGPNQITGFSAAQDGRLTPLPGSPYAGDVTGMALNGKYLFGFNKDALDEIDSFSMGWNGALQQVATTNGQDNDPAGSGCYASASIVLDHTGHNLYAPVSVGGLCQNNAYQSYVVEGATGKLDYLGSTEQSTLYDWPLTITANNVFAYGAECINYEGGFLSEFHGYQRKSDGLLDSFSPSIPIPSARDSGSFYCASMTAANTTNLMAVAMQAVDLATSSPTGPMQLAGYTVDWQGNLHTSSTYANMPPVEVGGVDDLSMSPSGQLLAVAGLKGLQLFHFGTFGIGAATGLLTTDSIGRVDSAAGLVFWDNDGHLYAISPSAGRLHVFNVTAKGTAVEAPGSPYALSMPQNMAVLPRTR